MLMDEQIQMLLREKDRWIEHLESERDLLERRVAELERYLDELTRSRAWKLSLRLNQTVQRVLPLGSRRRQFLAQSLRSARMTLATIRPQAISQLPGRIALLLASRKSHAHSPALPTLPGRDVQISIILPVFNNVAQTRKCLGAIATATEDISYELILVDDGSTDATSSLHRYSPRLIYRRNPRHLGFSASANRGAEVARGNHLIFLTNETLVTPGCISTLIETHASLSNVGLVGPKIVAPDGLLQQAGGVILHDGTPISYGRSDDPNHPRYNFLRETDYCSAVCISIPRSVFSEVGGFHPHGSDDSYDAADLAFRIRHSGHKVIYQPRAQVICPSPDPALAKSNPLPQADRSEPRQGFRRRWEDRLRHHPASVSTRQRIIHDHGNESSNAKRQILVIDHAIPTPDRDCGSQRMWELLAHLRSRHHHVTFAPDTLHSSSPYGDNLQALGIEVVQAPYYRSMDRFLSQHGADFSLIILSRAHIARRHIAAIRHYAPQAKLVFDTVDLQFLREQRQLLVPGMSPPLVDLSARKQQELELVRLSDLTLVVSPVEQEILEIECPGSRIGILPTIYPLDPTPRPGYADRRDIVFIGSFDHPPNVDAVGFFAQEILPLVHHQLPDVVFHVIGSNPPPEILKLSSRTITVHGHVPQVEPIFDRCRLSVAPLRFGAGVKGKINQSMALSVPVVVTSMASEGMHLENDHNALIADDPREFANCVIRLWRSPDLWEKLTINGRANLREHFSVEAAARRLDDLLQWAGFLVEESAA